MRRFVNVGKGRAGHGRELLRQMSETAEFAKPNSYRTGPDEQGHFGLYGGRFVAETLMPLILELEAAYEEAKDDPQFHEELAGRC